MKNCWGNSDLLNKRQYGFQKYMKRVTVEFSIRPDIGVRVSMFINWAWPCVHPRPWSPSWDIVMGEVGPAVMLQVTKWTYHLPVQEKGSPSKFLCSCNWCQLPPKRNICAKIIENIQVYAGMASQSPYSSVFQRPRASWHELPSHFLLMLFLSREVFGMMVSLPCDPNWNKQTEPPTSHKDSFKAISLAYSHKTESIRTEGSSKFFFHVASWLSLVNINIHA